MDKEKQKNQPTRSLQEEHEKERHYEELRMSHNDLRDVNEDNFAYYTSLMTASLRAAESERIDAVIHDPYAKLLGGDAGAAIVRFVSKWTQQEHVMCDYVAIRTRYLDDAIQYRHQSIHQVVLLGAGLDTRAYRLSSLQDCQVFEVDACEAMMKRKQNLLQSVQASAVAQAHYMIVSDLAQDAWDVQLLKNGFNRNLPTLWLMEGLLPYMDYNSIVRLIKTVDAMSASNSELWADMCGSEMVQTRSAQGTSSATQWEGRWRLHALQYGEDDPLHGVLSLIHWQLNAIATFDVSKVYFGRNFKPMMWYSENQEKKVVVPWFIVRGRKPKKQ